MLVESMFTMLPALVWVLLRVLRESEARQQLVDAGVAPAVADARGPLRPGVANQNSSRYSAISHAPASAAFAWASISERFIMTR